MREFLKSVLSEANGQGSSMRVVFLVGCLTFVLTPSLVWALVAMMTLKSGVLPEMPVSVTGWYNSGLVLMLGSKVWQKTKEPKGQP